MEAARARERYQEAVSLLSDLAGQTLNEHTSSKIFQLVCALKAMHNISGSLGDTNATLIWQQRLEGLHNDLLTSLTCLLQPSMQLGERFWSGYLGLLYAGAEACEKLQYENKALSMELNAIKEKLDQSEQVLQDQLHAKEITIKENMELRTRLVIQQQDLLRREAEARHVVQQLRVAVNEKDALRLERERLTFEGSKNLQVLERQGMAIAQLMKQCENNLKEKDEALDSINLISNDNKILKVNLAQHSKVIENLIQINTEMMEAANNYAVMQEQHNMLLQKGQQETNHSKNIEADQDSFNKPSQPLYVPGAKMMAEPLPKEQENMVTAIVPQHSTNILGTVSKPISCANRASPDEGKQAAACILPSSELTAHVHETQEDEFEIHFESEGGAQRMCSGGNQDGYNSEIKQSQANLHGKLSVVKETLHGVRGKAKVFFEFVAGADVAKQEIPPHHELVQSSHIL